MTTQGRSDFGRPAASLEARVCGKFSIYFVIEISRLEQTKKRVWFLFQYVGRKVIIHYVSFSLITELIMIITEVQGVWQVSLDNR